MMRTSNRTIDTLRSLGFSALLLVLPVTACGGTIEGQVLDAQTGKPIQGAVVLGVWTKVAGLPGLHHSELVGVKEIETDVQGRFVLDRPRKLGIDEEAITVYKFGYIAWSNLFIFQTLKRREDNRVPSQILLEAFPPGQSHRDHYYFIGDARRSVMYGLERIPIFSSAVRRELEIP